MRWTKAAHASNVEMGARDFHFISGGMQLHHVTLSAIALGFLFRKICANCHCPREEHDVSRKDEKSTPIAVGKLLFHPSATAETMITEAARSPKMYTSI